MLTLKGKLNKGDKIKIWDDIEKAHKNYIVDTVYPFILKATNNDNKKYKYFGIGDLVISGNIICYGEIIS